MFRPLTSFDRGPLIGACPGIVWWKYHASYSDNTVNVELFVSSPSKVSLVDGGVTFTGTIRDGVEIKNLTAGEIPDLSTGGWVSVFRVSNVATASTGYAVKFEIRVTFRLEKSFTCVCHSDNPCLGDACISLKKSLSTDLQRLYLSASSADVSFYIGQESVPAHQLILSARVPYFERLFASDMKEAVSKTITIEDADVDSFKELLKFIYSGDLPKDIDGSPETYLPLAEKYDLPDLKTCCIQAMALNLTSENAVNSLILADMYRCADLKTECLRQLREKRDLISDESLEPLKKHPELLLELYRAA